MTHTISHPLWDFMEADAVYTVLRLAVKSPPSSYLPPTLSPNQAWVAESGLLED